MTVITIRINDDNNNKYNTNHADDGSDHDENVAEDNDDDWETMTTK